MNNLEEENLEVEHFNKEENNEVNRAINKSQNKIVFVNEEEINNMNLDLEEVTLKKVMMIR